MPYDQYITYPEVRTPNIESDIKEYVLPDASAESVIALLESPHCHKLTVLAERLEFVHVLSVVRREIQSRHEYVTEESHGEDGSRHVTRHARCNWLEHDFAGVHWDIEALQIYLLITCLDTIAGQNEHKNAFEWLERFEGEEIRRNNLELWSSQFSEAHGPSRRFKRLFCERTSASLRTEWLASYAVVRLRGAVGGEPGRPHEDSLAAWERRDELRKISRIADGLYKMRSHYTHASARTFLRELPVGSLPQDRDAHLVRVGNAELIDLLVRTVQCVASAEFLERASHSNVGGPRGAE